MLEKLICLALSAALMLTGCASSEPLDQIGAVLGIDLSNAELIAYEDTHGGFHGDGYTYAQIQKPESILGELAQDEDWCALPYPSAIAQLVEATADKLIPEVENGYYFFYDRHSQRTDPKDPSEVNDRGSWNCTLAVYDAQSGTIYYYKLDT